MEKVQSGPLQFSVEFFTQISAKKKIQMMIQFGASYLTKTVKFHLVVGTIFYPHPKLFVTSPDPQGAGDYQKNLGVEKSLFIF